MFDLELFGNKRSLDPQASTLTPTLSLQGRGSKNHGIGTSLNWNFALIAVNAVGNCTCTLVG